MFDQNQPEEPLRYKKPNRHRYSVGEKIWTRKNRGVFKKWETERSVRLNI